MNRGHTLRLFGRPALVGPDGSPIRFRTRKHLALLVYLQLEARQYAVTRRTLIDLLWPDGPRPAGGHSLSQALTVLRSHLGSDFASRGGQAVRLVSPVETDLDQLEAGTLEAPDLTAPLADLDECGGTEFAHWVDAARVRVARIAADVLRDQLDAARTQGDVTQVHERAALLYTVDPLSDAAVHALAERCLLAGDEAGATRLLREHCDGLERELHTDPSPALRRLAARIKSGVPVRNRSMQGEVVSEQARRPQVFIGRAREMARLESLWAQVRAGRLLTCLITGAPGMGKSSLIERFAASVVARTWSVVTVTCQEIGRGIPFAVVADLLYALGRDPQTSGADPEWLGEASRLAPGLRARYPGIPQPPSVPAEAVKLRAAEAIVHVLDVVRDGGPMLLALDNVHQIDAVSAEILHLVLRRLEQGSVFILGTALDPAEQAPVSDRSAESITWHVHEPLAPLSPAQSGALVHALTRDETPVMPADVQEKVAELSQGIPYLVELLVADWLESGDRSLATAELTGRGALQRWQPPEMLRRAFARQYAGLDEAAQQVLNLLAVADRPLEPGEITGLLEMSAPETHRVNLQLLRQGIVRVADGGVTFKNELHRAYVYHATDEGTQQYLHRLIAGRLDSPGRDLAGAGTTELERSHHLARSGDIEAAVASALEGARAALERGAFREVESALLPLVDIAPPNDRERVSLVLAEAQCGEGKFRDAWFTIDHLDSRNLDENENVALARTRAEAGRRGRLVPGEEIRALAQTYLMAAKGVRRADEYLNAIQLGLEVASDDGEVATIERLRKQAQDIGRAARTPRVRAKALMTEGYSRLLLDEPLRAVSVFSEGAALFAALQQRSDLMTCLKGSGIGYSRAGDVHAAALILRELISVATDVGDADTMLIATSNLAAALHSTGDFSGAVTTYVTALELLHEPTNPGRAAHIYTAIAQLLIALQEVESADKFVNRATAAADRAQSWQLAFNAQLASADAAMARGDVRLALDAFHRAEKLRGQRSLFWVYQSSYERLKRHSVWLSSGYDAMRHYVDASGISQTFDVTTDIEIALFEEWATYVSDGAWRKQATDLMNDTIERGLIGVLVNLLALGIELPGVAATVPGQAGAALRLMSGHYPNRLTIPSRETVSELGALALQDAAPR